MSDPSDDVRPRHLVRIGSTGPGHEILVLDTTRRKLVAGVGHLETRLPDGLYKARFQAGDAVADVLFEVSGEAVQLTGPSLAFSTPMPLSGTSTSHEYHEAPARMLHALTIERQSEEAEIRIFVRDPDKLPGQGMATELCQGMSIVTLDGRTVLDLGKNATRDPDAGYAAGGVGLASETYLINLFHRESGTSVQLPVFAATGWTAMVFLDTDRSRPGAMPDLASASILLCPLGMPFDPDSPQLRLLELAKRALANGHRAIDASQSLSAFLETRDNPMLGILTAHILLLEREANAPALATLLDALQGLVPGHPDVVALQLELTPMPIPASSIRIPMLQSSWDILVRHSMRNPEVLADIPWLHRADALCSGRLWLTWQAGPGSRAPAHPADSTMLRLALKSQSVLSFLSRYRIDLFALYAWNVYQGKSKPEELQTLWVHAIESAKRLKEFLNDSRVAATPLQATIRRLLLALLDERQEERPELASIVRDLRMPISVLMSATFALLAGAVTASQRRSTPPALPGKDIDGKP